MASPPAGSLCRSPDPNWWLGSLLFLPQNLTFGPRYTAFGPTAYEPPFVKSGSSLTRVHNLIRTTHPKHLADYGPEQHPTRLPLARDQLSSQFTRVRSMLPPLHQPTGRRPPAAPPTRLAVGTAGESVELSLIPG